MMVELVAAKVGTRRKERERAKLTGKGRPRELSPKVKSSVLVEERKIIPESIIVSILIPMASP